MNVSRNAVEGQINDAAKTTGLDLSSGLAAVNRSIERKAQEQPVVIVGITGGSTAGKTSYFIPTLLKTFRDASVVSEDDFCIGDAASAEQHGIPNLYVAQDYSPERIAHCLRRLKRRLPVEVPQYSFEAKAPLPEAQLVRPTPVVFVEGCYLFQPHARELFDVRVFIDTDDHSRFIRHLLRTRRNSRQTDAQRVREYCEQSYICYYDQIAPYTKHADITISNPYDPREATASRVKELTRLNVSDRYTTVERYTHASMSEDESLSVLTSTDGLQEVRYVPSKQQPTRGANYRLTKQEYGVHLGRIGYTLLREE